MKKTTKFDIHCHVLPHLDDGAADVRETLEMIQMAVEQGVTGVIATPHCSRRFTKADPKTVRGYCTKLEAAVREKMQREFRIFPGQEILYADEVPEKLKKGEMLTLADSSYVLLEFMPDAAYTYLFSAVRRMLACNYWPVLAHVERYGALREKGRLEELIDMGAYIQMNYRSIGRPWYEDTARWCRSMLKQGNVHFLATDMHNTGSRSPDTSKAESWMHKHLEERYLNEICSLNAERIFNHTRI